MPHSSYDKTLHIKFTCYFKTVHLPEFLLLILLNSLKSTLIPSLPAIAVKCIIAFVDPSDNKGY